MSMIRVALFEKPADAEPVRQHLLQAGISAGVQIGCRLAILWYVPRSRAGARLEVRAKDGERAEQILSEADGRQGLLRGAIRCPQCKSLRIDYPQFTEKSLFTNLALGLLAGLGLVERDYYCEDCHWMWLRQNGRPGRARRNMAPDYFLEDVRNEPPLDRAAHREIDEAALVRRTMEIQPSKPWSLWRRSLRGGGFERWKDRVELLLVAGTCVGLIAAASQAAPINTSPVGTASNAAMNGVVAPAERSASAPGIAEAPTYLRDVLPILLGKCARCHSDESEFMNNFLDYRQALAHRREIKRRVWDSWRGGYFKQPMPVANSPESEAMTEEERALIRDWAKSGALYGVKPAFSSGQSKAERIEQGKGLFTSVCAACHQPTGQGIPGRFPPLAGSDFLNSDKHRAIGIVVNGLQGEVTVNGRRFNNLMPRFPLSDDEIASALTYVYNSFGNSGKDVTAAEVSAVRAEKGRAKYAPIPQTARVSEEKSPYE